MRSNQRGIVYMTIKYYVDTCWYKDEDEVDIL